MAERPTTQTWGELAQDIAAPLGVNARRAPRLFQAIDHGARYADVQDSREDGRRMLVLGVRALTLGMLSVSQSERASDAGPVAAWWFADWLERTVGNVSVAAVLSVAEPKPPDRALQAYNEGYTAVPSSTLLGVADLASQLARATGAGPEYEDWHMLGAMIARGLIKEQLQDLAAVQLSDQDQAKLEQDFADAASSSIPGAVRPPDAWLSAIRTPGGEAPAESAPSRPGVDAMPDFSPDLAAAGADVLDTEGDARAIARLICLEGAAPLAIAIFGGWGSGKSTFMERIEREVRRIAPTAAPAAPPPTSADESKPRFVRNVVQVRFNAWQFVDANLWASLTAELFDQLRAGGWDRAGAVRYASLIEQVNRQVHALNAEVADRRRAAAEGGKGVLDAQARLDDATRKARGAGAKVVGQAVVDALGDIYQSQKANLSSLGFEVGAGDTAKAVDALIATASSSRTILGELSGLFSLLRASPRRWEILGVCAGALLALWGAVFLWTRYEGQAWSLLAAGLVGLGALASASAALAPLLKLVSGVAGRALEIGRHWEAADREALKEVLQGEVRLRQATAEAEALQSAADQASTRLARYVDPQGHPNPPRLLRYILEDDPDTKALAAEVGLIGRTRRLFQALDDIAAGKGGGGDGEAPDRIVLYIDDLDRCTEQQVYSVLQAIHLLLAFRLFVVVVGVDVEWVQNALAASVVPDAQMTRRPVEQRAAQYLEKIFQIAFWLSPLTAQGDDGGSYGRYVRMLAGPVAQAAPGQPGPVDQGPANPGRADRMERPDGEVEAAGGAGPSPDPAAVGPNAEPETQAEEQERALSTIQLDPAEVEFLASPVIAALAAPTPRSIKRLVNVYRLMRARLHDAGEAVLGEGGRPPVYPLIALAAAMETGQPVEAANAFVEALKVLEAQETAGQTPPPDSEGPPPAISEAIAKCPALEPALTEVMTLRGHELTPSELLAITRLARRFSFNRYA
jgi:hypothetical protein